MYNFGEMDLAQLNKFFEDELAAHYSQGEIKVLLSLALEKLSDEVKINSLEVSDDLIAKYKHILKELKEHRPIQYILNQAHFFRLIFNVNEDVLIPRPETEELVFWVIQELKAKKLEAANVLDIGTGSGCVAISLKNNLPKANISAMDVSIKALEVAKVNALINRVYVNFIPDNILTSKSSLRYDVIVSNPPYVRKQEMQEMEKNVLDFEPHLALFVEDDNPLLFYEAIANFALKNLTANGLLFLEINEFLGEQTVKLLKSKSFINIELKKDMQRKDRMIRASKS